MSVGRRFVPRVLERIRDEKMLAIRAGSSPHRFIGIWAVVVDGRVFVRSWSRKPRSWWRTFVEDPVGAIQVGSRSVPVRAVAMRQKLLLDAIDHAYLAKYYTPGSLKYARDLGRAACRATTTELVPS